MLADIKKMEGINNTEFDTVINMYINSAKKDLALTGIAESLILETDALIYSAIVSYVRSFINVKDSELYANTYSMQKDHLRHFNSYKGE